MGIRSAMPAASAALKSDSQAAPGSSVAFPPWTAGELPPGAGPTCSGSGTIELDAVSTRWPPRYPSASQRSGTVALVAGRVHGPPRRGTLGKLGVALPEPTFVGVSAAAIQAARSGPNRCARFLHASSGDTCACAAPKTSLQY